VRASTVITSARAAWVIQVLLAGDHPVVAVLLGAGLQRAEVGAGVGLGEHGGRQDLGAGDLRQPFVFLRLRAAAQDQLRGDLGAGAERADADIAARQLLGDDAHRRLAHAEAAILLGDGQAEHAELGHLRDQLGGNQLVLQVPLMGVGNDFLVGEAAELVADHVEFFVEPAFAEGRGALRGDHQLDKAAALGVARARDQRVDRFRLQRDAEIAEPGHLVLAHRQAALELRQILGEADGEDQALHFAEPLRIVQSLRAQASSSRSDSA
jgi:hypothetical protein